MDAQIGTKDDEVIRNLLEKLKTARRSAAGRPEEEVRETLRQVVRAETIDLSEAEVARRLDRARGQLIDEARQREQRIETLEAENRRLASQSESLRVERDRLAGENQSLKAEPRQAGGGVSGEAAVKVRDALLQITQDREVTSESLGLSPADARFFRLVRELLLFALNFETGVHDLLQQIQVMRFGGNSMMLKEQKKIIRNRFRDCLDNKEGSVHALKTALDRNKAFLIALHDAYNAAIREGSRSILDHLDPQTILDETKGLMLDKFEKAWRTFSNRHADLSTRPDNDLWEQYFDPAFKQKLAGYIDPSSPRG